MKTRLFISTFILIFFGMNSNMLGQKVVELFNTKFPELTSELKISEQPNKINPVVIGEYRKLMERINNSFDDLEAYKYGVLAKDNSKVFTAKEIKKSKDPEELKNMLLKARQDLIVFIGTRTQYGADSLECISNLANYNRAMKHNKYDEAYPVWKYLYTFYPMSSKSIYSQGVELIENRIESAADDKKDIWVDTLMLVYKQRIKYFGNDENYPTGYIIGRQGIHLLKYRREDVDQVYELLAESIKEQDKKSECAVLLTYMQATEGMFREEMIEADEVVANFNKTSKLLAFRLGETPDDPNLKQAINGVEKIFANSEAASCDAIVAAYDSKFDEIKNDIEQLKKLVRLLNKRDCTDSKLYEKTAVQINNIEPSPLASYSLARFFARKKEYDKALEFYNKAIELETVDSLFALYYYEKAVVLQIQGNKQESRASARLAIEKNPNYGTAYILIANLYASSSCGADAFEKRMVYWVAVDKLAKAKSVDPSVTDEANSYINKYTARFPNKEEGFMRGKNRGNRVTVGCWIGESTTVRY